MRQLKELDVSAYYTLDGASIPFAYFLCLFALNMPNFIEFYFLLIKKYICAGVGGVGAAAEGVGRVGVLHAGRRVGPPAHQVGGALNATSPVYEGGGVSALCNTCPCTLECPERPDTGVTRS